MDVRSFSDELHEEHCRLAECRHPAVHFAGVQGWCARCRAVAFGGVYEGVTFRDGRIVDLRPADPSTN